VIGRAAGSVLDWYGSRRRQLDEVWRDPAGVQERVLRGHSHSGNVSAAELAARGWLDVLSSDYVPASVLHGAFPLHLQHGMTLPRAMATVSATPARRVGLEDRGAIVPGRRADLVRVRVQGDVVAVRGVWCRGERVA
jgi:alpha-D-ribose 1-methylphosphonate 5-triphosphate diphosphatase